MRLEWSVKLLLFIRSLESSVSPFGGSIDKPERNLCEGSPGDLWNKGLPEGDYALLGANNAALEHQKVLLYNTIVREATHWRNLLFSQISISRSVPGISTKTNSVNLFISLSPVEVTLLTMSGNLELNASRMPSTDTGNLSQTSVGLSWESSDTITRYDTLCSVTLGHTNSVEHFILGKYRRNRNGLLEQTSHKVNLIGNASAVDLDLHDMGLPEGDGELGWLCVADGPYNGGVVLDSGNLLVDLALLELFSVLGEGLLLGLVPVLVEPSSALVRQVSCPDGCEHLESLGGLDISNESDDDHWWRLHDGDSLYNLLLVELGAWPVNLGNDVGHTSLVAHEGREMRRKGRIVLGEGTDLSSVHLATLAGQETQGAAPRALKLPVRHFSLKLVYFVLYGTTANAIAKKSAL